MKKILFLSIAFCVFALVNAQKVYFIYLQSETNTPFYIRIADKVLSSTAEGYLILPKLKDSTYSFSLGQSGKSEAQFSVTINKGDRGFLIRTVNGQTSLFDLQTLSVQKPVSAPTSAIIQTAVRDDNFTKLLAKAADDTTLLTQAIVLEQPKPSPPQEKPKPQEDLTVKVNDEVPAKETTALPVTDSSNVVVAVPVPEAPKASETKDTAFVAIAQKDSIEKKDSLIATATPISSPEREPVKAESPEEKFEKSIVTKKSESSTSDGFGLVFIDTYGAQVDTIRLTIPNSLLAFADTSQKQSEAKGFLEISNQTESLAKGGSVSNISATKPSCTAIASDDDFFKLRRDMAAKKTEADMLQQASVYFKNKCFRSEQIKYLSTLFLSDKGKYGFFNAAFLHVSDQDKFIALQSEMKDPYYINRFRAMTAN